VAIQLFKGLTARHIYVIQLLRVNDNIVLIFVCTFYECGADIVLCLTLYFAFDFGCHFVILVFLVLIDV